MFECLKKKTTPKVEDRKAPSDSNRLWYPDAEIMDFDMKTRGEYKDGYPTGAVVHFTAGWDRNKKDAINTMRFGMKEGYAFLCITPEGDVLQAHPLNEWGYHAGKSSWKWMTGDVSRYFVGIEVVCAGTLSEDNESWFGASYGDKEVRRFNEKTENIQAGIYKKFTDAQEVALINLLVWLKVNNPLVFNPNNIVGHDEVAPNRKADPGGSLSMSMFQLRHHVDMESYKQIHGKYPTEGD